MLSLMTNGNDSVGASSASRTMSLSTPATSTQTDFTPPQGPEEQFQEDESIDSETDKVAKSFGVLHFNNNKAMYIGDAHWATILHEVRYVSRQRGS